MITMKKKLTILGLGLFLLYLPYNGCLNTEGFAQEGTIYDKANGGIPNQSEISDKLNTTQQSNISDTTETVEPLPDLEKLSDAMNDSFQNYKDNIFDKDNLFEIGGNPAFKITINGEKYCFLENRANLPKNLKGLTVCPLLQYVPDNKDLGYASIVSEAIAKGYEQVLSLWGCNPAEMNFLHALRGEDGCAYLKADLNKIKSSTQNKEE